MLKVMLIDDEEIALDVLEILLQEIGGIEVVGKYLIATDAIQVVEELQPDIIFLDIEMPGINGLLAAEMLLERYSHAEIIFVTAYHQYAVEAFESNAIGYLLKPVAIERLKKNILRYEQLQQKVQKRMKQQEQISPNSITGESESSTASHKPVRRLQLKLLGSLELYSDSGELITWRTKKTKELFAYLWFNGGRRVHRYRILEEVWPEVDTERAQSLFHTTMYNLRKLLRLEGYPHMVQFGDERYWMNIDDISSDYERLLLLIQDEGAQSNAEELLSIYHDDLLEMEHYEWASRDRLLLRERVIAVLLAIAARGEGDREQLLRKVLQLDPYDDYAYTQLIEYYQHSGRVRLMQELVRERARLDQELI